MRIIASKELAPQKILTDFDKIPDENRLAARHIRKMYLALGVSKLPSNIPNISKCLKQDMISHPIIGTKSLKLTLPGGGDRAGDYCGHVHGAIRCSSRCEKSKPILISESCDRLSCPECNRKAIKKLAKDAAERMDGMQKTYWKNGFQISKIKQWVISPPKDFIDEAYLLTDKGWGEFFNICSSLFSYGQNQNQLNGCLIIIHPWRKKHLDGSSCEDENCKKEHVWEYGPHAHLIGCGFVETGKIKAELLNWTIKTIKPKEERNSFDTIYYLLTHAGIRSETIFINGQKIGISQSKGHVYRWFGCFSYSKGGKQKVGQEEKVPECSNCGSKYHQYGVKTVLDSEYKPTGKNEPDYDLDEGEYQVKFNIYDWHVRVKGVRYEGDTTKSMDTEQFELLDKNDDMFIFQEEKIKKENYSPQNWELIKQIFQAPSLNG